MGIHSEAWLNRKFEVDNMKRLLIIAAILVFSEQAIFGQSEIYSYEKIQTAYTTIQAQGNVTELATIGGKTYISCNNAKSATDQLSNIKTTLVKATITPELMAELKKQSDHYKLILTRVDTYIKSLKKSDARYFMLSFDSIDSELVRRGINPSECKNAKVVLEPFLKDDTDLGPEIEIWADKQKNLLGLGGKETAEAVK